MRTEVATKEVLDAIILFMHRLYLFGPDTVDRLVLTDGGVVGASTTRDSERNLSADMNDGHSI